MTANRWIDRSIRVGLGLDWRSQETVGYSRLRNPGLVLLRGLRFRSNQPISDGMGFAVLGGYSELCTYSMLLDRFTRITKLLLDGYSLITSTDIDYTVTLDDPL